MKEKKDRVDDALHYKSSPVEGIVRVEVLLSCKNVYHSKIKVNEE